MFKTIFKNKPYLIYLISILVVMIGIYYGYSYYAVKKEGLTDDIDEDDEDEIEGLTTEDEENETPTIQEGGKKEYGKQEYGNQEYGNQEYENQEEGFTDTALISENRNQPAYEKRNNSNVILPYPSLSSVGPLITGIQVEGFGINKKAQPKEDKKQSDKLVQTYTF